MKKIFFLLCFIMLFLFSKAQLPHFPYAGNSSTGFGQNSIISSKIGLLFYTNFTDTSTANLYQVQGSIVGFLKNIAGVQIRCGNDIWMRSNDLQSWNKINGSGSTAWALLGNSGTDTSINFIGNTDYMPIQFRVNNTRFGVIDPTSSIGLGQNVLVVNEGTNNVAFSTNALKANTTGLGNIAIGANAQRKNITGQYNVAVGFTALDSNTAGSSNVAIGYRALRRYASDNAIAIGTEALSQTLVGGIGIGTNALRYTTGVNNIAIGNNSLQSASLSGGFNTAIGENSLSANTTGAGNTAFGTNALMDNTTGQKNAVNGGGGMENNTTGSFNAMFGEDVSFNATSGDYNTGMGYVAFNNRTTGSRNSGFGYRAGGTITTGYNNLFMGYGSGFHASQKVDAISSFAIGSDTWTDADSTGWIGATYIKKVYVRGQLNIAGTPITGSYYKNLVMDIDGNVFGQDAGGTIPTWQQTLTAGSTLTQDNLVDAGRFGFTLYNTTDFIAHASNVADDTVFQLRTDYAGGYAELYSSRVGGQSWVRAYTDSVSLLGNLIHLRDSSIGSAATNGYVWTLVDDNDGEGTWKPAAVGSNIYNASDVITNAATRNVGIYGTSTKLNFIGKDVSTDDVRAFIEFQNNTPQLSIGSTNNDPTAGYFNFANAGTTYFDNRGGGSATGIQYGDNYSADYTDRSLVDKAYVLTSISDSIAALGGGGTVTSVGFTGGLISVGTPTTTPAFTVAGTSGGGVYFNSASTWASTGVLAANALLIGGGAGAAYASTTTGTGVLTALGVNVGSSGAFQRNNDGFNGTVGATTPAAGTFTTAIANSFVPNSSTVPSNGLYLPASNTLGWAINSAAEVQLTSTALSPISDGGNSLGTTSLGWQNLFGNTGFVLNIENSDWVATHTTGILTVGTGDLRITTAGTNSASAVTNGGTQTLTNKTLTTPIISSISNTGLLTLPTVAGTVVQYAETSISSSGTPTPTGNAKQNYYYVTALAAAATFGAPTSPASHNWLMIVITDNGTARALSWNAAYTAGTELPLPTTTVISKPLYCNFHYNGTSWDLVGLTQLYIPFLFVVYRRKKKYKNAA